MTDICRCPSCDDPPTDAELEEQEREADAHADQTAEWDFCFGDGLVPRGGMSGRISALERRTDK